MWECIATTVDLENLPTNKKEIAFWGRSNVGKSSLINALAKQKIAYTSSQPGKTKTINFFQNQKRQTWVDLPGYGYARVSKATKNIIDTSVASYITQRQQLQTIFLLIDANVGFTKLDIEIINFLQQHHKSFNIILTKIDKANQKAMHSVQKQAKELGFETNFLSCSSKQGEGMKEIIQKINSCFAKNSAII